MGLTQKLGTIPLAIQTDSSNNVGIKTSTPRGLLDVRFNADRGVRFSSPGVSTESVIAGYQGDVSNNIRSLRIAADNLYFNTGDGTNDTGTQRMVITSVGNVGIGTNNPTDILHLSRSGTDVYTSVRFTNTNSTANFYVGIGGSGASNGSLQNNAYLYNVGNSAIVIATNDSERMRISSSGNVGIGTSSPGQILSLSQSNSTSSTTLEIINASSASTTTKTSQLLFQIADTGGTIKQAANIIAGPDGVNNLSSYLTFGTRSGDSNPPIERLRITSGGDILIAGGNTSGQSAVSTCTALRFPNQYSNGYTDAGVKLFIFNSGATIQGFTAGPSYDLQYHSSGDNTNGKHVWYVGNVQVMRVQSTSGNVTILGSLSKGSGSFKIDHPIESMSDTHHLVHSFVESPQANNIYRGKVQLINGKAEVNLDEVSTMTEGTFVLLNREIHTYTSNETDWDAVRGKVDGNILSIECQNNQSNAVVSWLVIGERQDKHMMDTEWTDDNGRVIVEPLKEKEIIQSSY